MLLVSRHVASSPFPPWPVLKHVDHGNSHDDTMTLFLGGGVKDGVVWKAEDIKKKS